MHFYMSTLHIVILCIAATIAAVAGFCHYIKDICRKETETFNVFEVKTDAQAFETQRARHASIANI